MSYLEAYLNRIRSRGNLELAEAIEKTAKDIVSQYIEPFSFTEHVTSLLAGEVQSGKTSHMFGVMCAAADQSFLNFILLTTDNILLQQQTYQRALRDLSDFCICGEEDYLKYTENNLRQPTVVVLKKNPSVLKQWRNNLASSSLCAGNPVFIVDDEADAASLNTQVNRHRQSTINKHLEAINKIASCSIYMQVTGTPQSLLLQTAKSGWKPYFTYYFEPGRGYLGGNFFFPPEPPAHIVLTDDDEAQDILMNDEFPENGLKRALVTHLITSGHIMLSGGTVCIFLIHPSMKVEQHAVFAEKIGNYLNEIAASYQEKETIETFQTAYDDLLKTKPALLPLKDILSYLAEEMRQDRIAILVLNSISSFESNTQYESGINILIGGNSLGRGVTFPHLQTIYYCRVAKNPQADTMWQHARMFGYDRDPELIRVFMPPKLYKLFSDINHTNTSIINQIKKQGNGKDVKIVYPKGLRPTRKNVLDRDAVNLFSGGVNYFPFDPINTDTSTLDILMGSMGEDVYTVSLKYLCKILEHVDSAGNDWDAQTFIGFLNSILAIDASAQGKLIVRRNRDIGKGTGTLLSPTDRNLGDSFNDVVVLTMYKITGNRQKGWTGEEIWIPNIKLPGDCVYYSGDSFVLQREEE